VVEPTLLPVAAEDVALIVVVPLFLELAVASPLEPAALLMVATAVFDELQVTDDVMFNVVPSEYVPVARNCCLPRLVMLGLIGVTVMDSRVADVIVKTVEPEILPDAAVIVTEPVATAVANP